MLDGLLLKTSHAIHESLQGAGKHMACPPPHHQHCRHERASLTAELQAAECSNAGMLKHPAMPQATARLPWRPGLTILRQRGYRNS